MAERSITLNQFQCQSFKTPSPSRKTCRKVYVCTNWLLRGWNQMCLCVCTYFPTDLFPYSEIFSDKVSGFSSTVPVAQFDDV